MGSWAIPGPVLGVAVLASLFHGQCLLAALPMQSAAIERRKTISPLDSSLAVNMRQPQAQSAGALSVWSQRILCSTPKQQHKSELGMCI